MYRYIGRYIDRCTERGRERRRDRTDRKRERARNGVTKSKRERIEILKCNHFICELLLRNILILKVGGGGPEKGKSGI